MKSMLLVILLIPSLLLGCSHEEIRIVGSSHSDVLIYDPNNDTLYAFDTFDWSVQKWPHWNKGH